jgi:hypothetical protein
LSSGTSVVPDYRSKTTGGPRLLRIYCYIIRLFKRKVNYFSLYFGVVEYIHTVILIDPDAVGRVKNLMVQHCHSEDRSDEESRENKRSRDPSSR